MNFKGLVRRSRNQLEKADLMALDATRAQDVASPPRPSKRTSSLLSGLENTNPSSKPASPGPATIRHFRSMLEIEPPPSIGPLKPISFDELYDDPEKDETQDCGKDPAKEPATALAVKRPKGFTSHQPRDADCQDFLPLPLLSHDYDQASGEPFADLWHCSFRRPQP